MAEEKAHGFAHNVAVLLGGASFAQAIRLCLVPIVARLFVPEHFGIAALFTSLAAIFSIPSTLRYDQAIVLPQEESEADALTAGALLVLVLFCSAGSLVVVMVSIFFPEFQWVKDFRGWLLALPVAVFLLGMSGILTSMSLRRKRFATISASEILQSLTIPGSRIGLGLWSGSSVAGLIVSLLFGFAAKLGLLRMGVKSALRRIRLDTGWAAVRRAAKKYKDFPIYTAPTGMMQSFYRNMPVLLLGLLYPNHIVGFYTLASRLVRVPVTLVSESVRKAYLQKSSELRNNNQALMRSLAKTTMVLCGLGLPFSGILFFFGEQIFTFLLGSTWTTAGTYAALLTPLFFVIFILPPSSVIFVVLRKQSLWFRIQLGITVTSLLVFVVCHLIQTGPEQTLLVFALWNSLTGLGVIVWAFKLAMQADSRLQDPRGLVSEP